MLFTCFFAADYLKVIIPLKANNYVVIPKIACKLGKNRWAGKILDLNSIYLYVCAVN